jgi:hypothetical protein
MSKNPLEWRTMADIPLGHKLARPVQEAIKVMRCDCPAPYDQCTHDNPIPDAVRIMVALDRQGLLR